VELATGPTHEEEEATYWLKQFVDAIFQVLTVVLQKVQVFWYYRLLGK
jgi:hypothetical protein